MSRMELKIPPVAQFILALILMWLLLPYFPTLPLSFGVKYIALLLCTAAGLGIGLAGVETFRQVKTTVNPIKIGDASALVNRGIYRYTRNPMYLGLAIILLGIAIALASPLNFLVILLFMRTMERWQIAPEERVLTDIFGKAYQEYQAQVGRWL